MNGYLSRVHLPIWTIALGLLAVAIFLYLVRAVLPPFLVGGFIAYVLSPLVGRVQDRWGFPRPIAIASVYLALLGPLVLLAFLLGPRLLDETRLFLLEGPRILTTLIQAILGPGPYNVFGTTLDAREIVFGIAGSLRATFGTTEAAIRLVADVTDLILNVFLTLVVSIYLLGDGMRVGGALLSLFPSERRDRIVEVSEDVHGTLARYLRRQLVLIGFVATVTFVFLEFVFHLRYALPIAVFTGIVEIIPLFGPVIAATLAGLVALSQGGLSLFLGVIVFYIVLRQIEDQVVMPVVLGRAVELHPIVVIFAVLAGSALFGVLGALAAVPIAASIKVVLDNVPLLFAEAPKTPTQRAEPVEPTRRL